MNTLTTVLRDPRMRTSKLRFLYKYTKNPNDPTVIESVKARLILSGWNLQKGLDYKQSFSAMVRAESVLILFCVGMAMAMIFAKMDIKTFYLYGRPGNSMYAEFPVGYVHGPPGKYVLLISTSIYGTPSAGREAQVELDAPLANFGFKPMKMDPRVEYSFIGRGKT
jgi:hypothetical protein